MNLLTELRGTGLVSESDYSLAQFCTYRVGGAAKIFLKVESKEELLAASELINKHGSDVLVLGKGSNVLVSDAGFDGVVVQLGKSFDFVDIEGLEVMVGGITFLPIAARKTAAASLAGFEWAVGVPGSMGGAVRMNAGGHGSDIAESLVEVTVFDFATSSIETKKAAELELRYRSSSIQSSQLVLSAKLALVDGNSETSKAEISEIVQWRRTHQPGGANAGSVFANPEGDHAARLIDSCGLKGFRIGSAAVSDKHANFIQATAGESADDVYKLIQYIRGQVLQETGFDLRCENRLIGFENSTT